MDVQPLKNFDVGTGRIVEVEFTSLNLTHNFVLQGTIRMADCESYACKYNPSPNTFVLLQYRYMIVQAYAHIRSCMQDFILLYIC